jgi:hypothetical protein
MLDHRRDLRALSRLRTCVMDFYLHCHFAENTIVFEGRQQ